MTNTPCNFEQIEGGWQCQECGHVHPKPNRRPPVRRCGNPKALSPPKPKTKPTIRQKGRPMAKGKSHIIPKPQILLGDRIKNALGKVGITEEKVTKWLGVPCGCDKRRKKLNDLDLWVHSVLSGTSEQGKEDLESILDD